MRLLLRSAFVCILALESLSAANLVTISDTIATPLGGRPAVGSINISWPSFTEPDGTNVPSGSQSVTLSGNGMFTVSLYPTDQASIPGGGSIGGVLYTVTYSLATGQSMTDHWNVPTTAATLKIANVLVPIPGELRGPSGIRNPNTCVVHDLFFNTATQTEQICVAPNTWDVLVSKTKADQQYLADSGAAGLVFRAGSANATRAASSNDIGTALGYQPPNPANGLSEYTSTAAAARTNLGIQSAATHPATDFVSSLSTISLSLIPTIPSTQISGLGTAAGRNDSYFVTTAQLGAPSGAARLDSSGKLVTSQLPTIDYSLISNAPTPITRLGQLTNDLGYVLLSQVSTAGRSGSYTDLINKPALNFDPAGSATTALAAALQTSNALSELSSPTAKATARNNLGLQTLAATGAWADIIGKPTTFVSDWTAITSKPAFGTIITKNIGDYLPTTALGTSVAPLTSGTVPLLNLPTIPASQTSGFGAVATSNSYTDLLNKPTGLPPTGTATGDLCGTYPAPTVCGLTGTSLSSLAGTTGGILKINSSGQIGLAGVTIVSQALGFTPLNPANNGSEFSNKATARTNLGLGTIATANTAAYLADSGTAGLVFRSAPGVTRSALYADITSLLGFTPLDAATRGAINGVAPTGSDNKIPLSYIPVIPYSSISGTPTLAPSATIDATNANNISSGTLNALRLPPIASTSLSDSTLLARTGGSNTYSVSIEPSTPTDPTKVISWFGQTTKNYETKDSSGTKRVLVTPSPATAHTFVTSVDETGLVGRAQPTTADVLGLGTAATASAASFLADSGANGLVTRTAQGTTAPATVADIPSGYPATSLSGMLPVASTPALTGEVIKAAGSSTTTLRTVNGSPGLCGSATQSCQITTDALGRVLTQVPINISGVSGGPGGGGNVSGTGLTAGTFIAGAGSSSIITSGKVIPTGAVVGTTDTQTLTNKTIDASEIATGTLAVSLLPSETGDVTRPAGSAVNTLATVNSSAGACGDSTHFCTVTTNNKGLVTGQSAYSIPTGSGPPFGLQVNGTPQTGTTLNLAAGLGVTMSPSTASGVTTVSVAAASAAPNSYSFSSQSTPLTITHNLGTTNVIVACYDASDNYLEFGSYHIVSVNAISLSFAGAPTGRCVVNGGVGAQGPQGVPGAGSLAVEVNGGSATGANTLNLANGSNVTLGSSTSGGTTTVTVNANTSANATSLNGTSIASFSGFPFFTAGALSVGTAANIGSLFTGTSACYLKKDGTCDIPSGGPGGSFYQTLQVGGSSQTQRGTLNLVAGSGISLTPADSSSASTVTIAATGSSSGIARGTLAAIPSTCAVGDLYFATDAPQGQQLQDCSATNVWSAYTSLGGSGALAFTGGSLDVVPSVVPTLAGSNSFTGAFILANTGSEPTCSVTNRGQHFFLNGGSSADHEDVCNWNGSGYVWTRLF